MNCLCSFGEFRAITQKTDKYFQEKHLTNITQYLCVFFHSISTILLTRIKTRYISLNDLFLVARIIHNSNNDIRTTNNSSQGYSSNR